MGWYAGDTVGTFARRIAARSSAALHPAGTTLRCRPMSPTP